MARLASRHCTTLKKDTKPMRDSVAQSLLNQLNPEWRISKNRQAIDRVFQFDDFQETVGFVNAVAWIANLEDHHPDLQVTYNRCEVSYTSHIAKGLTVNDFICASKIDALFRREQIAKSGSDSEEKPAAEKVATTENIEKALQFDAAEADALLQKQAKPKPAPVTSHDDEDEFQLIDPDEESTVKQNKATATVESAAKAKTAQPAIDKKTVAPENVKEPVKPQVSQADKKPQWQTLSTSGTLIDPSIAHAADDFNMPDPIKHDIDLMSTVILPPGMVSVSDSAKPKDEDEESTVILPDTTATAEIDEKTVNIAALHIEPDNVKQDTFISEKLPTDDDIDRTLILAPHQVEEYAVGTSGNNHAVKSTNTAEENIEKTMLLTSDPTHAVRRLREPAQPPAETNKNKSSVPENTPVKEENVEKTMALSSDPTNAVKRQTSSQAPAQEIKNKDQQDLDPGIEDDETLVMHSNTYKSINHDPDK